MKELIRESFELWCRMRWLRVIDRENSKLTRLKNKTNRQIHVVKGLVDRYQEIYGEKMGRK